MTTSTILSDNGATSGSAGLKTVGGNDGTLVIQTTTAGGTATTAVAVDTSQNVGIGTSSPGVKLDVVGALRSIPAAGSATLYLNTSSTQSSITNPGSAAIAFLSSDVEKMRIDSSGNLLVGTTTSAANNGGLSLFNSGGTFGRIDFSNKSGAAQNVCVFYYGTTPTLVGRITTDSTSTAYTTSSDYRLKENIQPMQNALATVSQLNPVTYTWKADGSDGQGFIAHELAEVVPDCVTGEKDAVETYTDEDGNEQTRPVYQGIDTSFLVATLTAAIQEQQAIITQLQSDVAALKGQA